MRKILLILGISLLPTFSQAQEVRIDNSHFYMSTNDLMSFCRGHTDIDFGYCAGYVSAIAETMLDNSVFAFNACNHGPVQDQQLVEIVGAFVNKNPARLHEPAARIIAEALATQFSCSRE